MATPVRDFWPLTPRPAVLPLPEPMPRPTRMRPLRAPALSAISFSFIFPYPPASSQRLGCKPLLSCRFLIDAHQMAHLVDHAAHRRRVLEDLAAVALVEAQALQGRELIVRAADRASRLGDLERLLVGHAVLRYALASAAASAVVPSRRPSRSPTFLPRRVATMRGELS